MSLLTNRRQLAIKAGSEGSFSSSVLDAAYAKHLLYEPKVKIIQDLAQRNPIRQSLGSLADLPAGRLIEVSWKMELKGSGVAGTEPSWGLPLKACGWGVTTSTGTMVIGTVVAKGSNLTPSTLPTVAGTFAGTLNGRLRLTITAIVATTSIAFRAEFFPDDFSANYETNTATQTDTNAETLGGTQLSGVTVDFGDPSASTAAYQIGDEYIVPLTSDQSVQNVYKPISTSIPVVDMGFYQDGRLYKIHSARGNMKLMAKTGTFPMLEFTFRGAYEDYVDAVLLTGIVFETTRPVAFKGVTASLFSATPQCFTNLEIDNGNTLSNRECATAASGYSGVTVTDRRITGKIDPLAAVKATADYVTKLIGGTTGALALTHGTVSGNIITLAASNVQVTNIDDAERGGDLVDALDLLFNEPEYDAGGDYAELVITAK